MPAFKGLILLAATLWIGTAGADVSEIRRLLAEGNAAAAYELAVTESEQQAGDPGFDFVLGQAALEAGYPERAVFALERVLMIQPGNHRARLELARAHYVLGEYQTAREHFAAVLATDPPESVSTRVQKFVDAIDDRIRTQRRRLVPYVELSLGTDSNINSATTDTAVNIPALGLVPLSTTARETEDGFREIRAAIDYSRLFSKTRSLFANLSVADRNNFSSDIFDIRAVDLITGPVLIAGKSRFRIPLQAQVLYVDNDTFRNLYSISGDWTYNVDATRQVTLSGQGGALTYPDRSERDATLALLGGSWIYRLPGNRTTFTTSAYYGDENADEAAADYNGRKYAGLRVGLQWVPRPKHAGQITIGAQTVEHDSRQPVFNVVREDDFAQLTLAWHWRPVKNWLLSSRIDYQNNNSTIPVYEYDRVQFQAGARYLFQ